MALAAHHSTGSSPQERLKRSTSQSIARDGHGFVAGGSLQLRVNGAEPESCAADQLPCCGWLTYRRSAWQTQLLDAHAPRQHPKCRSASGANYSGVRLLDLK